MIKPARTERVLITGIGVLSAIGNDFSARSASLRQGLNGAALITAFDTTAVAGRLGCEVRDFDPAAHFDAPVLRRMDRSGQLAVAAAIQAVAHAAIDLEKFDPQRIGVSMGTTLGGLVNATRYDERLASGGLAYASLLYDYPLYSAGARMVGEFGISVPNIAFSTACSSGNIAISHAADLIRLGRQDVMLAGGVDTMAKIALAGFNALRNVTRAIKKVVGAAAHAIPICSTKSMHGHVLGATGAIEAMAVMAAMRGGFTPPTINYQEPDPRCDLDYVPYVAREQRVSTAISNNLGFGGKNCTLVLGAAVA